MLHFEPSQIRNAVVALLGDPNPRLSTSGKIRYGNHGSLAIDLDKAVWFDHEQCVGGAILELIGSKTRLESRIGRIEFLHNHDAINGVAPASLESRMVKTYCYRDATGAMLFEVVRYEPKKFLQRQPDGKGGWLWHVAGVQQVPYRLPELLAHGDAVVHVAEGEKDCDRLSSLGLIATCNAGGAGKWRGVHAQYLKGRHVVVLPDNDEAGRNHARQVAASLQVIAADVRLVELPGLPPKGDVSDWLDAGGTVEGLQRLAGDTAPIDAMGGADVLLARIEALKALDVHDLANHQFKEREVILAPILHTQDLAMIFANRGVGKTHFALAMSYAIATGGKFAKWSAPCPRRVLYLDGELPGSVMQKRLLLHCPDVDPVPGYLRIFTPDLLPDERSLPDLSTTEGQEAIEPMISDAEVVVVDNLSAWARTGRENEAESWLPVADWMLRLRRRGISVILVHHAGKSGQQRGTSKREDLLDLVIELRRPKDYTPSQGAVFITEMTKARNLIGGPDAESIELALAGDDERAIWTWRTVESSTYSKVVDLTRDGLSPNEIAAELEINKSTVSRHLRKARECGDMLPTGKS